MTSPGRHDAKAVLFDYDDTLVDTRTCKYAAIKEVARRHYDSVLTDLQIDQYWGIAYRQLFERLFVHLDNDVDRVILRYEELDEAFAMTAFGDTRRTLDALLVEYHVGIVTAAGRTLVERQLRRLELPVERLAVLQTAEDTLHHKPDPRVFEPALARLFELGVQRQHVTYVGDSLNDFAAARDAGLSFFGILRGTTSRADFERAGARTLEALDDLLLRL